MAYKRVLGLALMILSLSGCNLDSEVEIVETNLGYDYFPLGIGRSWTYVVDSVKYRSVVGGISPDSSSTFARELIVDTLRGAGGGLIYRVERYERKSDTLPWEIRKVFTLSRLGQQAIRNEDNLSLIALAFPARPGATWSPQAYFDPFTEVVVAGQTLEMFKDWRFFISQADERDLPDGQTLMDVLRVENLNADNLFEYRRVEAYYARGVGLVEQSLDILDSQCLNCCDPDGDGNPDFEQCDSLSWSAKAERGFSLRQRLIQYE